MNIDKIQCDIVKAFLKSKMNDYNYALDDDNVYIIHKSVVVYVIPKDKFVLDLDKVFKKSTLHIDALLKEIDEAKEATYLYDKKVDDKEVTIYECDDYKIAFNKKLLGTFGKDLTIKAQGAKKPAFVYDYDVVVGVILPVYLKDYGNE